MMSFSFANLTHSQLPQVPADFYRDWVSAVSDSWSAKWLALPALTLLLFASYFEKPSDEVKFWRSQPLVGVKDGQWFASFRAKMKTIFGQTQMMADGYERFSKTGKAFTLPVIAFSPYLMLPLSALRPLMSRQDEDVNVMQVNREQLKSDYTLPEGILDDPYHHSVGKILKQKLPYVTEDIVDEIHCTFEDKWPHTKEWAAVKIYPLVMKIVSRVANRVFLGPDLCRSDEFLDHSRKYTVGVVVGSMVIKLFPGWTHPVIAPLIAFPNRRNMAVCQRLCQPIVQQRLDEMKSGVPSAHDDLIQWFLNMAHERHDPDGLRAERVVDRLMTVNMVAIHTSSMAITNLILNLCCSSYMDDFVAGLREEVDRIKPRDSSVPWTKPEVDSLLRIDSALRETMRFSTFGDYGVNRLVTAPDGITFDGGLHVPPGSHVAFPLRAIHRDPAYYDAPDEFDPFRFSRTKDVPSDDGTIKSKSGPTFVTPTEDHLGFGAGRHACPGRFFASHELKLVFAHLIQNFDFEALQERPQSTPVLGITAPSGNEEVRVRLRNAEA